MVTQVQEMPVPAAAPDWMREQRQAPARPHYPDVAFLPRRTVPELPRAARWRTASPSSDASAARDSVATIAMRHAPSAGFATR